MADLRKPKTQTTGASGIWGLRIERQSLVYGKVILKGQCYIGLDPAGSQTQIPVPGLDGAYATWDPCDLRCKTEDRKLDVALSWRVVLTARLRQLTEKIAKQMFSKHNLQKYFQAARLSATMHRAFHVETP